MRRRGRRLGWRTRSPCRRRRRAPPRGSDGRVRPGAARARGRRRPPVPRPRVGEVASAPSGRIRRRGCRGSTRARSANCCGWPEGRRPRELRAPRRQGRAARRWSARSSLECIQAELSAEDRRPSTGDAGSPATGAAGDARLPRASPEGCLLSRVRGRRPRGVAPAARSRTSSVTNRGFPSVSPMDRGRKLVAWCRAHDQLDATGDLGQDQSPEPDEASDRLSPKLGNGHSQGLVRTPDRCLGRPPRGRCARREAREPGTAAAKAKAYRRHADRR